MANVVMCSQILQVILNNNNHGTGHIKVALSEFSPKSIQKKWHKTGSQLERYNAMYLTLTSWKDVEIAKLLTRLSRAEIPGANRPKSLPNWGHLKDDPDFKILLRMFNTTNLEFLDLAPKVTASHKERMINYFLTALEYSKVFTAPLIANKALGVWPIRTAIEKILVTVDPQTFGFFWDKLEPAAELGSQAQISEVLDPSVAIASQVLGLQTLAQSACLKIIKSVSVPGIGLIATTTTPELKMHPNMVTLGDKMIKVSIKSIVMYKA